MAELEYGVVRGRYRLVQSNVSRSAVGTVLFTAIEPDEIVDVPEETLYSRQSVEAVFDGDGWIHAAGTPVDYLRLPVGRWEVSFRNVKGLSITPFKFDVTADETVNLPAVAPIKPSPDVKFVVNELVYTETLDARDETFEARDVAVQAAADAVAPTNTVVDARIALKRGAANGVAALGSDSKLPETQVPDRLSAAQLSSTIGAAVAEGVAPKANAADVYSKTAADSAIATAVAKTSAARKRRVNFLGGTPSGTNTALSNVLYRVPFRIPHKGARLWLSLQNQANGTPITGATWTMTGAAVAPASLDGNGAPDGNGSAPFTRIASSTPAPADGSALVIGPIDAAALPGMPGDLMILSIGLKTTGFTNGFTWARSAIPVFYRGSYADTDVMTQTITVAGTSPMYTDFAMLWETNPGVLSSLLVGDSLTEGFGAGQWLSVPQRLAALTSSAVASAAQTGITAQAVAGFGSTHPYWTKAGLESGFIPDQALVNLGSNDLNSGRTAAQIIADLTTICAFLDSKGITRLFGATITPRSFPAGYVLTGVAAGVTSFTSNYDPGTGPIQIGQAESTIETVNVASVSGSSSPFTITLSAATTKAHAPGDIVAKTTGTAIQVAESERVKLNIQLRANALGLVRVIDYDAILRDATNPTILTLAKASDAAHPNAAGYEDEAMLARAIVAR